MTFPSITSEKLSNVSVRLLRPEEVTFGERHKDADVLQLLVVFLDPRRYGGE